MYKWQLANRKGVRRRGIDEFTTLNLLIKMNVIELIGGRYTRIHNLPCMYIPSIHGHVMHIMLNYIQY